MASHQSSIAVSASATWRTPCQAGSPFHASRCAVPSKPSISSVSVRLYSARSWADRIRCMLFTEMALLCMLVGARRFAFAYRYRPEPVVHVHPRAYVALDERDPVLVPLLERLGLAGVLDVLVDLPHHVGVVAVEGEFPLLVRVAELVPAGGGPVVALAAGAGEALGLGAVGRPRPSGRSSPAGSRRGRRRTRTASPGPGSAAGPAGPRRSRPRSGTACASAGVK